MAKPMSTPRTPRERPQYRDVSESGRGEGKGTTANYTGMRSPAGGSHAPRGRRYLENDRTRPRRPRWHAARVPVERQRSARQVARAAGPSRLVSGTRMGRSGTSSSAWRLISDAAHWPPRPSPLHAATARAHVSGPWRCRQPRPMTCPRRSRTALATRPVATLAQSAPRRLHQILARASSAAGSRRRRGSRPGFAFARMSGSGGRRGLSLLQAAARLAALPGMLVGGTFRKLTRRWRGAEVANSQA